MSETWKTVEFVQPHLFFQVGETRTFKLDYADELIERGLAKAVERPPRDKMVRTAENKGMEMP